jgi:hypothetical protein
MSKTEEGSHPREIREEQEIFYSDNFRDNLRYLLLNKSSGSEKFFHNLRMLR